uniref:Uncharacterized protein n=1 Tax=Arcella intermedia TaxID=1963864 RepID=A0A6B2LPK1_9EUKA
MIVAQILCIQFSYYVAVGFLVVVLDAFFGVLPSLDQLFDGRQISFQMTSNIGSTISLFLAPIPSALVILYVVGKAKKVLDFTVSKFLIHLVICSSYGGFPTTWVWWVSHLVSVTLETLLAEFLCLRSEHTELMKHSTVTNV